MFTVFLVWLYEYYFTIRRLLESNSGNKLHVHELWVIALKTATLECVLTSQKKINCFVYSKSVRSKIPTPPLNSRKIWCSPSVQSFIVIIFYKIQSELHQDPDYILLNNVEKKKLKCYCYTQQEPSGLILWWWICAYFGYSWRNLKQLNGLAQLMITKGKLRFPRVPVMKVRSQRTMDTAYV